MIPRTTTILPILFACACSQTGSSSAAPSTAGPVAISPQAAPATSPTASEERAPLEPFTDAQRVFLSAKDTLLANYYSDGLKEDDLYRAALEGMLEHAEPKMARWNKLLSPSEVAELHNDLKGEVVGVGLQLHFDDGTGRASVISAIAGSPAEKAGIQAGDEVLSVDGKLYKGKALRDLVADIRGRVGETVTLSVLHGDKILVVPLKREAIAYGPTASMALPDAVGYLRIRTFSEKTPAAARAELDTLSQKGMKALIVDLRGNQGGLFDEAVATAGLLLPAGAVIVKTEGRDHKPESFVSKGPGLFPSAPMAVLVDGSTSSSAEFMAAALHETRHAPLVGGHTFGKWSVQKIDDLSNGYAIKYTTRMFATPAGKSYEGVGILPDVEASMDAKDVDKAEALTTDVDKRLAADAQLRTAVSLLR